MFTPSRTSAASSTLYPPAAQASIPSMNPNDILVCATARKIYAIHKLTGQRIWRADFVSAMSSTKIVSVFITDFNTLLVAGDGEAACLDLFTGKRNWSNALRRCGFEEVGIICTASTTFQGQQTQPPSYDYSQNDHCAAGTPIPSPPAYRQTPIVIACTSGKCVAMDAVTGVDIWRFECPNGGRKMPSVLIDPPNEHEQRIFIGCGRMVYCLDALSGRIFWSMQVSNAKFFSPGYMTMATAWSSRLAAEANTSFNQFPSVHKENASRQWPWSGSSPS